MLLPLLHIHLIVVVLNVENVKAYFSHKFPRSSSRALISARKWYNIQARLYEDLRERHQWHELFEGV
jgi:hypothetical protein